jgi:hypothetical protein
MRVHFSTRAPLWFLIGLLSCWPSQSWAQQPACDPGLHPLAGTRFGYGPREDRCEGVYVKQVGGTALAIASLTSRFEQYDVDSGKNLRFAWSASGDSVRIRVRSIQPDLYYGMDAARPACGKSFEWPIAILSSLKIRQPDIGVLAWSRRKLGGEMRDVFIPVGITQSGVPAASSGYSLVLFPGVKLKEVYLTLGPADADGRQIVDSLIKDREPQKLRFYPPERPIRISIPPLNPPGLYYLEVSGALPNGSAVPVEPLLIDTSEP